MMINVSHVLIRKTKQVNRADFWGLVATEFYAFS
jgi:hypothetical protein